MSPGDERRNRWLVSAGLVAVVLLLYAQVAQHQFVTYDDGQYVSRNAHVQDGLSWEGVAWAFTTTQESNWHPLTWISLQLDAQLFGLDPGRSHLANVLLHALNAVLLFWAFVRMTGATWPPALAAALFALHPLRVESVAWASARKDVLSGLFFFLLLLAYARYARRQRPADYGLCLAAFTLGLLAKPMLVTVPFVLLLLDAWPLRRLSPAEPGGATLAALVREKVPFAVLAAASCVVTYVAQARGGSVVPSSSIPLAARLANAAAACFAYLWKTIWPAHLAVLYPHSALAFPDEIGALYLRGALAVAGLAASVAAVWLVRGSRPYVTVGWLWYLGMLVPVLGVVQVGIQSMADRYTYLPLIGVSLAIAWGLRDAVAARPSLKPLVQLATTTALFAFAALTWLQVGTWKDSATLYRHAIAATRGNYAMHNNLGSVLPENSAESESEYRRALAIRPAYPDARYNLGTVLESRGDFAGARTEYELALAARPEWLEARNNLAGVLTSLGDEDGAITQWRELIRSSPQSAHAHLRLGKLLASRGDAQAALAELETAARLAPGVQEYLVALAEGHERAGKPAEIAERFAEAARQDPASLEARFNLAVTKLREGRAAEAERVFRPLAAARPDDPQVRNGLAIALASQGKLQEAEAEFTEALRIDPSFVKASQGLEKVRRLLAARGAGKTAPPADR